VKFAGGYVWCVEEAFSKVKGVEHTVVGYTGGTSKNSIYEEVSSGRSDHIESLQVTFEDINFISIDVEEKKDLKRFGTKDKFYLNLFFIFYGGQRLSKYF
jgi:hypothetical protein